VMLLRVLRATALAVPFLAMAELSVSAQTSTASGEAVLPLSIRSSDRAAASSYSDLRVRVFPRLNDDGTVRQSSTLTLGDSGSRPFLTEGAEANTQPETLPDSSVRSVPGVPPPGFYPADVAYHGGALLKSVQSNNVYVSRPSTEWGDPAKFLADLGKSTFVHTIDQYVHETSANRYTVGIGATILYPIFGVLGNNDLLQIVHSAASFFGSGYGHIYHVFLPKGVDFCDEPSGQCYSPDNPSTFVFCAFHGSVQFSDIGHVIFSLEPYQNVLGCSTQQPSPNGALIDSTDNVLSHELFEAISDPDPGSGWYAQNSLGTFGQEIGDLCPGISLTGPFFKNPVSRLNGHLYEIQLEYSNTYHACANVP